MTQTDPEKNQEPDAQDTNEIPAEDQADLGVSGDAMPEAKIAQLETALAESKDKMMRALAEAENTRRRALKDREDSIKFATAGFARDLLDFSDNFKRALEAFPEEMREGEDQRLSNVYSGLQAMERELLGVFDKHKIKKIIPLDEPFNANFHEVMFEAPVPGKQAGTIIEVIEPGYVLHDRLLRPARVGVAKGGDGAPSTDPGQTINTEA